MLAAVGDSRYTLRHVYYVRCGRVNHTGFPRQRGGQAGAIEVADRATTQGGV